MSARILNLSGTVHPKAEIQSVSAQHGVATFRWLDADGNPVDSGGSVARFTPLEPTGTPPAYPEVPDATLVAAIENPAAPVFTDEDLYAAALAPGYLDVPTGIRLKTVERAQAKFARMVTLIELALGAGAMTSSSDLVFFDFADQPQTLTVANFKALMLRYGVHCKGLFDDLAP